MHTNVLFICKKNHGYGAAVNGKRSGLYNSTRFVAEALRQQGIIADVVEVGDNNDIDRELALRKPKLVVIEALWVVPEKFDVLKRKHPKVQFAVHLHSNAPFLALEGVAVKWCREYDKRGIKIIVNSTPALQAVMQFVHSPVRLNNCYSGDYQTPHEVDDTGVIHVGCFGAVRPMKNQFTQALAALDFAKRHNDRLYFHINATRSEGGGDPVLTNLRELFKGHKYDELIEHSWYSHHDFLQLLQRMDLCTQVSMSETFNIVTADCVLSGLPVVTSREVPFVSKECHAETDSVHGISYRMDQVYGNTRVIHENQRLLKAYNEASAREWYAFVEAMC